MRIIAVKTLRQHWEKPGRDDSENPLKAWYGFATKANWATPADVKADLRSASIIGDNRVVFNIAGNKYRLIVKFSYPYGYGYIRFVGTHAEYDRINAEDV